MRHSPDLSDTNTSIVIYCDKMEIIIIIIFKKQKMIIIIVAFVKCIMSAFD